MALPEQPRSCDAAVSAGCCDAGSEAREGRSPSSGKRAAENLDQACDERRKRARCGPGTLMMSGSWAQALQRRHATLMRRACYKSTCFPPWYTRPGFADRHASARRALCRTCMRVMSGGTVAVALHVPHVEEAADEASQACAGFPGHGFRKAAPPPGSQEGTEPERVHMQTGVAHAGVC